MNKQEVIDEIENAIPDFILNDYRRGEETGLSYALELVEQLNEAEKPVVPQFVADWYEDNKDDFENSLAILIRDYFKGEIEDDNLLFWFGYDLNKDQPIKTLVNMHQFGYEVEKEKLYTVFQLATKEYLFRFHTGVLESLKVSKKHAQKIKDYHFTQAELEELQYWDNPAFEVEEVEE